MTREEIEKSAKFRFFLIKFGVHWIKEYETFTEEEKKICLEEFKKTQKKQ